MNWGKAFLLFLFLLFNLAIVCIAALLIYVSVHYYITLHEYKDLLENSAGNVVYLVTPLVVMVTVSLLLLLLALVGCISGACGVRAMYILYVVMLLVLLVLQIVGVVLVGVFEGPVKSSIAKGMIDNLHLYNDSSSVTQVYDSVQRQLECCGVNNYTDWGDNGLLIPQSCCKAKQCDTLITEDINTEGCLLLLFSDAHKNGAVTISIIVLFGIFEISGLFLAVLLICCRDEKVKTYQNLKEGLPKY